MIATKPTCDIFCRVVDNYGDIGVTWRLARQLVQEHGLVVRLMVDNLPSLQRIVPEARVEAAIQDVDGVTVHAWQDDGPPGDCARLVIEAFACELPGSYLQAMADAPSPPVWINLEYLSAESWVAEHHLMPSPHPRLGLVKYFFFPGFSGGTGGLIREAGLFARRDAYTGARADRLRVLVLAYVDAPAEALLASASAQSANVRVMAGELADRLQHWRSLQGESGLEGAPVLAFDVQDFVPQREFDALLWRHDVLFVRGEDSFVRAQWAGRPFVWHIYPQAGDAHLVKLHAFLETYTRNMPPAAAGAVRVLWLAWNGQGSERLPEAWQAFVNQLPAIRAYALEWADGLARLPDLASNLLSFYRKNAKI